MRITSFWAKAYRSLKDVRLEGLGPWNVFYGENGAGKSNILMAMRVLFGLAARRAAGPTPLDEASPVSPESIGDLFSFDDINTASPARQVLLGATLDVTDTGSQLLASPLPGEGSLTIEVHLDWSRRENPALRISRLEGDRGGDVLACRQTRTPTNGSLLPPPQPPLTPQVLALEAFVREDLPRLGMWLVPAVRFLRLETRHKEQQPTVQALLAEGRLKEALVVAQTSPDALVRDGFKKLRSIVQGPPLNRPPFDPVEDRQRGLFELREQLPRRAGRDIPLDQAGLGIIQVYTILAQILLQGSRAVGIEEPEAHLHAPTTGRHLRELLRRVVEEGYLDQIFIATHSNLFDLDPGGYFDVRLQDGTVVERVQDLSQIDARHLYEPGPAKHALERMLTYLPEDEVVFYRPDGSTVSAQEMLRLLQQKDDLALRFLEDVHGAAVRAAKFKSKKRTSSP